MVGEISNLLAGWFSLEPSASLLIIAVTFLTCSTALMNSKDSNSRNLGWFSRLIESLIIGFMFLSITGAFYFLLNSSFKVFRPQAEKLSKENVTEDGDVFRSGWGGPLYQNELHVDHSRSYVIIKEIPDLTGNQTLYINENVEEEVAQESITDFDGYANIHFVDQEFQTYWVNAIYKYGVANQSSYETKTNFSFPIGTSRIIQDLVVKINDKDIKPETTIKNGVVLWQIRMSPGERVNITISYITQGSEVFVYRVPTSRQMQNFSMKIDVDTKTIYRITQPDTTAIKFEQNNNDLGRSFLWTIDNAIVKPELGVKFKPLVLPDPNQILSIKLLQYAPRGLMFFASVFVLTFLVLGVKLELFKLVLTLAVYSANFLFFMGLDLLRINHWAVLPVLGILTLVVVYLIYRRYEKISLDLILIIGVFFILGYPYAGFLSTSARTAFDSFVQAFVIAYIFILSLYVRIWRKNPV